MEQPNAIDEFWNNTPETEYENLTQDFLNRILNDVKNIKKGQYTYDQLNRMEVIFKDLSNEYNDERQNIAKSISNNIAALKSKLYPEEFHKQTFEGLEQYIPTPFGKPIEGNIGPSPLPEPDKMSLQQLKDLYDLLLQTEVKDMLNVFERYYYKFGTYVNSMHGKPGRKTEKDLYIKYIYNLISAKLKAYNYTKTPEFPTMPQKEFPDYTQFFKEIVDEFKNENKIVGDIANKLPIQYQQQPQYSQPQQYSRSYFPQY